MLGRTAICALALVGCGRVGFDSTDGGSTTFPNSDLVDETQLQFGAGTSATRATSRAA